jgi:hypothetical protein
MPSTRSTAKTPRHPKGSDREETALEQKNARARKREALALFVEKNAKVLAELAK